MIHYSERNKKLLKFPCFHATSADSVKIGYLDTWVWDMEKDLVLLMKVYELLVSCIIAADAVWHERNNIFRTENCWAPSFILSLWFCRSLYSLHVSTTANGSDTAQWSFGLLGVQLRGWSHPSNNLFSSSNWTSRFVFFYQFFKSLPKCGADVWGEGIFSMGNGTFLVASLLDFLYELIMRDQIHGWSYLRCRTTLMFHPCKMT